MAPPCEKPPTAMRSAGMPSSFSFSMAPCTRPQEARACSMEQPCRGGSSLASSGSVAMSNQLVVRSSLQVTCCTGARGRMNLQGPAWRETWKSSSRMSAQPSSVSPRPCIQTRPQRGAPFGSTKLAEGPSFSGGSEPCMGCAPAAGTAAAPGACCFTTWPRRTFMSIESAAAPAPATKTDATSFGAMNSGATNSTRRTKLEPIPSCAEGSQGGREQGRPRRRR
mmetsp:Transcript_107686/g.347583  ORF Transcript_107686/g.347583 Transcript_107686/m.347583 type:complete len:223 (+) Transcript_107686:431-1099(+)